MISGHARCRRTLRQRRSKELVDVLVAMAVLWPLLGTGVACVIGRAICAADLREQAMWVTVRDVRTCRDRVAGHAG
jgi:hypothetical protein